MQSTLARPTSPTALQLYGSDFKDLTYTITNARNGTMPAWGGAPRSVDDQDACGLRAQPGRGPMSLAPAEQSEYRLRAGLAPALLVEAPAGGNKEPRPTALRQAPPRERIDERNPAMSEINVRADDHHEIYDEGPLYASAAKVYPQRVKGTFRRLKWTLLRHLPRPLLFPALRSLGPWTQRAAPGGAGRFRPFALLLLLHRAVAAGGLLFHRPVDPRLAGAVPLQRVVRPRMVRLFLPADGVDRPLLHCRALGRRRPPRPHQARRRAMDRRQDPQARRQACASGS